MPTVSALGRVNDQERGGLRQWSEFAAYREGDVVIDHGPFGGWRIWRARADVAAASDPPASSPEWIEVGVELAGVSAQIQALADRVQALENP